MHRLVQNLFRICLHASPSAISCSARMHCKHGTHLAEAGQYLRNRVVVATRAVANNGLISPFFTPDLVIWECPPVTVPVCRFNLLKGIAIKLLCMYKMRWLSVQKDFSTRLLVLFIRGLGVGLVGGHFTAPACPNVGFAVANEAHHTFKDLETAYPVSSWYITFCIQRRICAKHFAGQCRSKSYFAADRRNKLSAPILDIPCRAAPDQKGLQSRLISHKVSRLPDS